ncbi:Glucose N-acetyltransferase 1 [Fusarium keratoplasticum]|uniref:Glucose N-acetyltransferase 1 n=1 Tax=Fusarium keratoplasticum TaxID=1328300 RepID=A0ACC0QWU0_9HYPO|nr:Glucose N-acetyltransferase 1 [Fusarium keratoplasticum]KAI8668733.1 Glucose N-acetyltransferase 1 [Fusarium keratoplasticum]KAI8673340.1 Glucose N-acetyltransferase 1 [Fusarium keratoplasticum]
MSRLLRFLPTLIFLTIFFLFLLNLFEYDYPDVPLPDTWRIQSAAAPESTERAATTPGGYPGSPSFLGGDKLNAQKDENHGEVFANDESLGHSGEENTNQGDTNDSESHDDQSSEGGDNITGSTSSDSIDWSRFAYVQYVTDEEYLCNSLMIFEALHRFGSKADRLMLYPGQVLAPDAQKSTSLAGKLLIKARDEYNVILQPIEIQHREGQDQTWADSFTKLLVFNQTQYDRLISLDSDGMLLQLMDELFRIPPCQVAMPRAYWLMRDDPPKKMLSSHVMVVQPDKDEFERVLEKIDTVEKTEYDMEILNKLYLDSAMVIPHRPYAMLTAEFRMKDHTHYLGSDKEEWDPVAVLNEAKYVHFSDWPVPKPWIEDLGLRQENQPECPTTDGEQARESCIEREIWNNFYTDFSVMRKVSNMLPKPFSLD